MEESEGKMIVIAASISWIFLSTMLNKLFNFASALFSAASF